MTLNPQTPSDTVETQPAPINKSPQSEPEKILCPHCRRTATNGIKCQGMCVADSDY